MLSSGRSGKSAVKSLSESLRSDPITFAAERDSGLLAQKHIQDYTLGLDRERVKFKALRRENLLFSDQITAGQLSQDIGDISTGELSGKDMGKVMAALMPKVKGKADGNLISTLVRQALG